MQLPKGPAGLVTLMRQTFLVDPPVQLVPAGSLTVMGIRESAPLSLIVGISDVFINKEYTTHPKFLVMSRATKLAPVPLTSINAFPGPPPSLPAFTCCQFIVISPLAPTV